MTKQTVSRVNRRLLLGLFLVVIAMYGFSYAMVPLYDKLCEVTGLNGKTSNKAITAVTGEVNTERTVTVEFVANVNESAPLEFKPNVIKIQVRPGKFYHTSYFARNLSDNTLVLQAIPSVSPGLAARHFQKVECFCFSKQTLRPGEGRDMPVTFRLDPGVPLDIATITLSYTFFRLEDQGSEI